MQNHFFFYVHNMQAIALSLQDSGQPSQSSNMVNANVIEKRRKTQTQEDMGRKKKNKSVGFSLCNFFLFYLVCLLTFSEKGSF